MAENTSENTTWAENVVELINDHIDQDTGRLICQKCRREAFIYKCSETQEGGEWERWIKGVRKLSGATNDFTVYVFLISHEEDKKVDCVQFGYYKDLRRDGGHLKHGHGPGAGPVIAFDQLNQLANWLGSIPY